VLIGERFLTVRGLDMALVSVC